MTVMPSWVTNRQKRIDMKFINYMEKISGISIYGLSSLVLFVTIFTVMLIWALKADKKMIKEISNIPLNSLLLL